MKDETATGIPPELVGQIRRLEIKSRKLVDNIFSGEYHSAFKGSGMEFANVREYAAGDDVRKIDWNVTARTGKPFIKQFHEERELTVMLLVDASASGYYGSGSRQKRDAALEAAAAIGFSALRNGDKVGLLLFAEEVEVFIPPAKGRRHLLRLIRELLMFKPNSKGTDLATALVRLNMNIKRRGIVFLISDLQSADFSLPLRAAGKKHDVIAMQLFDAAERELPNAGLIELVDPETGEQLLIDSSNEDFRNRYRKMMQQREEELSTMLGKSGVDRISIDCSKPVVEPLINFFRQRGNRLASGR